MLLFAAFALAIPMTYYRFRENLSDLERTTASDRGSAFWKLLALAYAIMLVVLYALFRHHSYRR